ncbi:MAG TPA: hypothetical protein QGF52_05025 [Nitrososphaerales archaeon]|nr:hypothetical protein [Nitrososphaerales archaeon]
MVQCPECKTDNKKPSRTWKILDEPNRFGVFNERGVGIFQCFRCGTTFPSVVGNRQLAIVDANKYAQLNKRITALIEENTKLKEEVDVVSLQAKVDALEREVSTLINEKKELHIKLSRYR